MLQVPDQLALPPRERIDTLPQGVPVRTLGFHAAAWMADNLVQPNGPRAGLPFVPTDRQIQFLLDFYELNEGGEFVYRHGIRRLGKGQGKALRLDEPVFTPLGWRRFGDLRVGDEVFGADGCPTRVTRVHPVGLWESFRLVFSDGSSLESSGEHLFTVEEFVGGRGRRVRTLSVRQMLEEGLVFDRPLTRGSTKAVSPGVGKFALPEVGALELPERDLPVDPYVLGVWLADGDSDGGRVTFDERDEVFLRSAVEAAGYEMTEVRRRGGGRGVAATVRGLRAGLRGLGVLGCKRIPEEYLMGSAEQRRSLLAGLLDSDGYVGVDGQAEFCQVRREIVEGVAFLLRSLGVRVTVRPGDAKLDGRTVGVRYRLSFKPYKHHGLFRMPRKEARVRVMRRKPMPRIVREIVPVEPSPMRCITVDNPDGLFVVGECMIVTHNSPFAAATSLFELLGPCRFGGWDESAPFGVRAVEQPMPLIQVVATSERQTANTMRMVRAFSNKTTKLARKYDLDPGKTFVETPGGGKLEQVTSSARTLEGAEVSFLVGDEEEHWVPSQGGPELMETLKQNAAKTGARIMSTCNAWEPGEDSVAEANYEAWCAQEEGRTRGELKILYDARMAPANAVLTDEPEPGQIGVSEALEWVYEDCPWANLRAIKGQIWDPAYPASRSMRFFFNRPTAVESSWVTLDEWVLLADRERVVEDGEDIVMFFDGSKSNDHTALVGCCMRDGFVFKIGHWPPEKATGSVNVGLVDSAVRQAFARWNVVAFWADVREWESFVRVAWPEEFGEGLIVPAVRHGMNASPIAWDMRSHAYQFAEAAETVFNEVQEAAFRHDGDPDLGVHVANCRVSEFRGRFSVKKESPKSPKKIDLAVCMIGARMLYRHVKASAEWEALSAPKGGWAIL